jgi:hypothetical protein
MDQAKDFRKCVLCTLSEVASFVSGLVWDLILDFCFQYSVLRVSKSATDISEILVGKAQSTLSGGLLVLDVSLSGLSLCDAWFIVYSIQQLHVLAYR